MGEWRKVQTVYGETGSGVADRSDDEWQFGAEIDGVFVPAFTKSDGYIQHLIERGKAAQEQEQKNKPVTESGTASTETA